jgi:hypothetical protein
MRRALIVLAASFVMIAPAGARAAQSLNARTLPAYGVNATEAVLSGLVDPHGRAATFRFQWGTTRRYGHIAPEYAPEESIFPGDDKGAEVQESLVCLAQNTTYHFRVVAYSHGVKSFGRDKTFRTFRAHHSLKGVYGRCPKDEPIR